MPQAARKDAAAQRAQDKEAKRSGGRMSCAECRRLKLKCSKTIPCESCKRRGCSSICPNGSLITGQGTRFVLADTEKLHRKIQLMSDRIRQLEDALAITQSTGGSSDLHPLLADKEALKIKSIIELHAAIEGEDEQEAKEEEIDDNQYIDAFGTLAIRDDGASTFYGRSAGSESLLIGESDNAHNGTGRSVAPTGAWLSDLPPVIQKLSETFLIPSGTFDIDVDYLVERYLPEFNEAVRLIELYLEQAPWFFGAVVRKQIVEEVLPTWYGEVSTPSPPYREGSPPVNQRTGHNLALLFIIFCHGSLIDMSLPAAPDNPDASRWYQLTRAALALEPVLDRPSTVATVQTVSMMAIYQGLSGLDNSIEATWGLFGLASKLAQSTGLHRDNARWNVSAPEVQKRRALFWEIFITDCWQALATGRLATFNVSFVDAELPFDTEETLADDGTPQPSFPAWKAKFGRDIVSAVVSGTLTSKAPKYPVILELDRKIRDFELPKYAQPGNAPQGKSLGQTMLHFMPQNYRQFTLVYIHRGYFSIALQNYPSDPIKSPHAPSFLAGYRSACDLLGLLRLQFSMFPQQIARAWVLWTHAFSSAIMISSVVRLGPRSKVAPAALLELKSACALFEEAAAMGGRARKFLPLMQRHLQTAHSIYVDTHNGVPPTLRNNIFSPSSGQKDDLQIFSGQTHTVATRSDSVPRSSQTPPESASTPEMAPVEPPIPSFIGAHPKLVSELQGFEVTLNAQISHAYCNNNPLFAQALMPIDAAMAASQYSHSSSSSPQETRTHAAIAQSQFSESSVRTRQPSFQSSSRVGAAGSSRAEGTQRHNPSQSSQVDPSSTSTQPSPYGSMSNHHHQGHRSSTQYAPYPQTRPSHSVSLADPSQLQSNLHLPIPTPSSRSRPDLRTQSSRPSLKVQSSYGFNQGSSQGGYGSGSSMEVSPSSTTQTVPSPYGAAVPTHYTASGVPASYNGESSTSYHQQTGYAQQAPYDDTYSSNGQPYSNGSAGRSNGGPSSNQGYAPEPSYHGHSQHPRASSSTSYPSSNTYAANGGYQSMTHQPQQQMEYHHHSPQNTNSSTTSAIDDGVQSNWTTFMYSVGSPAAWSVDN